MNVEEIQRALATLHAELSQVTEVDDTTRQRLRDVNSDIDRILGAAPSEPAPSASDSTEPPFAENLQNLVTRFGAKHPQLTATVQQLVDRLSEIGI